MFTTLHLMFETQYNELALAVDEIAERIRALGFAAPGSYAAYAGVVVDSLEADDVPIAEDMIRQLAEGQETLLRTAREVFPTAEAGNDNDSRSADPAHAVAREECLDAPQHDWMIFPIGFNGRAAHTARPKFCLRLGAAGAFWL